MKQKQTFSLLLDHQEYIYMRHYIRTNRRLLLVVIIVLGLLVSGMLFSDIAMNAGFGLMGLSYSYGTYDTQSMEQFQNLMLAICILAYLIPLYQFHFLMKRSSSDLYLSLPIRRERLFYVHYLAGAAGLVLISIIEALIYFLFHFYALSVPGILLFMILMILGVCLYTFFTFLVLKCQSLLDAILICMIYTFLPVIFHVAIQCFISNVGDSILKAVQWSGPYIAYEEIISYVTTLLSVPWLMNRWIYLIAQSVTLPLLAIILYTIVWVCFSVSCFFWARKSFVILKSEDSEQPSASFLTYPLIIPALTLAIMLGIGKGTIFSIPLVLLFPFYLIAYFAAQRKIKITWKQLAPFVVCLLFSVAAFRLSVETDLFHIITELPEIEEYKSARLSVDIIHNQQRDDQIYESNVTHYDTVNGDLYGSYVKRLYQEQEKILSYTETDKSAYYYDDETYALVSFEYSNDMTENDSSYYTFHRTYLITGTENLQKLQASIVSWQNENMIYLMDHRY